MMVHHDVAYILLLHSYLCFWRISWGNGGFGSCSPCSQKYVTYTNVTNGQWPYQQDPPKGLVGPPLRINIWRQSGWFSSKGMTQCRCPHCQKTKNSIADRSLSAQSFHPQHSAWPWASVIGWCHRQVLPWSLNPADQVRCSAPQAGNQGGEEYGSLDLPGVLTVDGLGRLATRGRGNFWSAWQTGSIPSYSWWHFIS